jgi:uncharacterized membrane protein
MKRLKRIPLILLLVSLIWVIILYATPASLPPGSVVNLDGRANFVDYQAKWKELPVPQNVIYQMGDLNCHQKYERSFIINGNQMPMCARDIGVFLGINIGIALVFFVNTKLTPTRAFLNLFFYEPRIEQFKSRKIVVGTILFIAALPILVDGLAQGLTSYESTNGLRLVTGLIFGLMFSYATVVLMSSIAGE